MIQDYIITAILWLFGISLIPTAISSLKGKSRVSMITGIPTTIGNYALAIIWLTFPEPLYVSFISSTIMGTLWLLVTYGSWKQ